MYLGKDEEFYALGAKNQEDPSRFYIAKDVFNTEELDYLAKIAKQAHAEARVGGAGRAGAIEKSIRVTKIHFLKNSISFAL